MIGLAQRLKLENELRQSIGDHSGDIPIYSLHKIKNLLGKRPLDISRDLNKILVYNLVKANGEYKEDSGNDWNCLTSNNLVKAITNTEGKIKESIDLVTDAYPREQSRIAELMKGTLEKHGDKNMDTIKGWFEQNYDLLLYDTSGKIPYPIILQLRKDLSFWITSKINPFEKDIEDFIIDAASKDGKRYSNAEDAWIGMGGKLFK